ncbi:MAG TPA: alpha/beta hydrolase [Bradyrhizobium sp.]|nr:alpha/beta hydrolase [Bradyrhizobium sp.]
MAAYESSAVSVHGCELRLLRAGSGAPLVVLRDAVGPLGWEPYLAQLAQSFDVIVPTHPGFGGTPIPAWLDGVSDYANFYLDLLGALDLRDVHLMGAGLGGWIAADLATRNTSRLASLTLVDANGLHLRGIKQTDIFLGSDEDVLRSLFVDEKFAGGVVANLLTPESEDVRLQNQQVFARVSWQPRLHDPNLSKWLHRIDVPTHIIWGDGDRLLPKQYAAAWQQLIAGSQVTVIAGSGHLPHIEKPKEFLAAVERFLLEQRVPA